jgi:ABC-type phosphate transport system substrate-binding protein
MRRHLSLANRVAFCAIMLALALCSGSSIADVVAVVSSKSPVTTLSKNQVVDIFLGRASRFPNGEPALPIDQAEGSAVRDEFYAKVAGKAAPQVKAHWAKIIFTGRGHPPEEAPNSVEVKKLIAKNPNAIGYMENNLVDGSVRVLLSE